MQVDHSLALKTFSQKWHANSLHISLARASHIAIPNFRVRWERKYKYLYLHLYICVSVIKSRKKGRGTPSLLRNPTATLGKIFGRTWVKNRLLKNGRVMDLWRGSDELKYREKKFITEILIWGLFLMSTFILFLWKYQDLMTQLFCVCFSCTLSYCFAI